MSTQETASLEQAGLPYEITPAERHTAEIWLAILRDLFTPETWTRAIIDEVVALERQTPQETARPDGSA